MNENKTGESKALHASALTPAPLQVKSINTPTSEVALSEGTHTGVVGGSKENKARPKNVLSVSCKTRETPTAIAEKSKNALTDSPKEHSSAQDEEDLSAGLRKASDATKTIANDSGSQTDYVRSVIPSEIVPFISSEEVAGQYALEKAREKVLKESEFAILRPLVKSWVHCALCKVQNEDGGTENLTVILDPHYHYHPRAWNEHVASEEHMKAVDAHRRKELQNASRYLHIINGSSVRCMICSGQWKKGKERAAGKEDDEDYEGVVALDPAYPYHPRAWREYAESWAHVNNWTAMNRAKLFDA